MSFVRWNKVERSSFQIHTAPYDETRRHSKWVCVSKSSAKLDFKKFSKTGFQKVQQNGIVNCFITRMPASTSPLNHFKHFYSTSSSNWHQHKSFVSIINQSSILVSLYFWVCIILEVINVHNILPGAVARSEASSLGMQAAPSSIPTSSTFFRVNLVMKTFLRPFSLFRWFKKSNCQLLAKECALSTGKLPRRLSQEHVARLTDRARNDLKCVEGP